MAVQRTIGILVAAWVAQSACGRHTAIVYEDAITRPLDEIRNDSPTVSADSSNDAEPLINGHPSFPVLGYGGGHLLQPIKIVSIVAVGDPAANDLFAFGDALIQSAWWQSFAPEYNLGTPSQHVHVTGSVPLGDLTVVNLAQYVTNTIVSDHEAAPDGNTLFLLYLPEGATALVEPNHTPNTDCSIWGGFHLRYDRQGNALAIVQRCPANSQFSSLDLTTILASHEIAEAATDPDPPASYATLGPLRNQWASSIWWNIEGDDSSVEIADLCEGTSYLEGNYQYQRVWSIRAAAAGGDPCVPQILYPYESVGTPQDWYPIMPNGTVNIPFKGWSTGSQAQWSVTIGNEVPRGAIFSADFSGDSQTVIADGVEFQLTVHAGDVSTDSYAVFRVWSFSSGTTEAHFWPVGVYVPRP